MLEGVALIASGSATPSQRVTNEQLSQRVDTNDTWIKSRTGICARHVVGPNESLSTLSKQAGEAALAMAGWDPESIDLLILATSTPDDLFGSAPKIQGLLGTNNAVAFDLTAACSGFLFSLITASQYLRNSGMRRALVIGADQLSSFVDWDDRTTCVLFGDGAGAIALEVTNSEKEGILGFNLKTNGPRGDCLNLPKLQDFSTLIQGVKHQEGQYGPIKMNGQEVYKFAVREVPEILEKLLISNEISPEKLDWLLLHQANQRILNAVAERLSIPESKVLSNLAEYGNTSAATIPIMLDEAVRDERIQTGHLIATSGFGAGLSWGAALLRWQGTS